MKLEKIKISELSCDPANARKHPDRNIETIVASLKRFGQQKPIVIDSTNVVRAGNGTLEAARSMGWTEIDCVRTSLKGSDAIAYAIADNRTAELAEWDDDVLAASLNGLLADDPDLLNAAGFSDEELMKMLDQFNAEEIAPPGLAEGDREPFRQMTFTVHDSQFEVIEAALKAAKSQGGGESAVNENSNGNALAFICNAYTSKGARS
jgi:ParB-like chromosome segregation protein Spo0J